VFSCNLPQYFWQNDQDLTRAAAVTFLDTEIESTEAEPGEENSPTVLLGLEPVTF